ncbi:MAG TPA: Na+/H+ antiporter subunit E [Acidimicrobiales bacterium]
MRHTTAFAVALLTIWCLAWGSVSWANLASGVAVSVAVLVLVPDVRRPTHLPILRPWPALRLVLRVLRDVAVSNAQLVRLVLTPRPRLSTGVVRVPLAGCSDEVVTTIANLVAMTPGTMPIEVEDEPTVLYVHVLSVTSPDEVRRAIWSLRDRVLAAIGTRQAIAEVARVKADSQRGEHP